MKPLYFAYPAGSWNEDAECLVKKYYKTARHWDVDSPAAYITRDTDPYRLPCIHVTSQMPYKEFCTIIDNVAG